MQMDVWSKDSILFATKKTEITIRGNCKVRNNSDCDLLPEGLFWRLMDFYIFSC